MTTAARLRDFCRCDGIQNGVKTLRTQDTSDLRHFGTGAEVSGHFGTGAEMSVRHFGTEVSLV